MCSCAAMVKPEQCSVYSAVHMSITSFVFLPYFEIMQGMSSNDEKYILEASFAVFFNISHKCSFVILQLCYIATFLYCNLILITGRDSCPIINLQFSQCDFLDINTSMCLF